MVMILKAYMVRYYQISWQDGLKQDVLPALEELFADAASSGVFGYSSLEIAMLEFDDPLARGASRDVSGPPRSRGRARSEVARSRRRVPSCAVSWPSIEFCEYVCAAATVSNADEDEEEIYNPYMRSHIYLICLNK